jgi:hypothetical protein
MKFFGKTGEIVRNFLKIGGIPLKIWENRPIEGKLRTMYYPDRSSNSVQAYQNFLNFRRILSSGEAPEVLMLHLAGLYISQ